MTLRRQRRVRVATPCYRGMVTREYAFGLVCLAATLPPSGWPLEFDMANSHLLPARNELMQNALASEADILLWLDADVAMRWMDPSTLWSFLRAAVDDEDVAIVGARCGLRRGADFERLGHATASGDERWNVVDDIQTSALDREGPMPYKVQHVGMGCAAWNMAWWRRFFSKHPGYFYRDEQQMRRLGFFQMREGRGEDYLACQAARAEGGRVLLDPLMPTWHDGMEVKPQVTRRLVELA